MPAFRKPKYLQHTSAGMINNLLLLITLSLSSSVPFRSERAPQLVALFSPDRKQTQLSAISWTETLLPIRRAIHPLPSITKEKSIPAPQKNPGSAFDAPHSSGQNTAHNSANYILHATFIPAWAAILSAPNDHCFQIFRCFTMTSGTGNSWLFRTNVHPRR